MSTIRTLKLTAAILCLSATAAFAAPRLNRPVSVQEGRSEALRAAGVNNVWRGKHNVTLIGFSGRKTVVMVKSPDLRTPVIVSMQPQKQDGYRMVTASRLDDAALARLGFITPSKALKTALKSGGQFGGIKGKVELAGASRKGYAYRFTVTPDRPVDVKLPYGTLTVTELTRMVSALGTGETAFASKATYKPN